MQMKRPGSKQAIAAALLMKRREKKMSSGGFVEEEVDLDEEHERGLYDLQIEASQPPVANPAVLDAEMHLAQRIHELDEQDVYGMSEGGLVEPASGDEEPVVKHDGTEEPMSEEDGFVATAAHAPIPLSREAIMAIKMKKAKRIFRP